MAFWAEKRRILGKKYGTRYGNGRRINSGPLLYFYLFDVNKTVINISILKRERDRFMVVSEQFLAVS